MSNLYQFTSESVSMGHPDKVADQISDTILDAMLREDPDSRVACETMVTTGMAVVAGEVTCDGYVDIPTLVREKVLDIGYDEGAKGLDGNSCAVLVCLDRQSPDIARGVDKSGSREEQGAGDQGLMFGFACRETPNLMPLPIDLAHKLVARQADVRRQEDIHHLRPDAKSQVTVEYEGNTPQRVQTVVLSTQHGPEWNSNQRALKDAIIEHVIQPVLGSWWNDDIVVHVNPTGRFEIGGPHGDCGLTGRKIIVDTYGGRGRHGGGAFSGKDPSKVDRSAAYMARYIAKNLVAAELAEVCEVQLSYAIGVAEPTSVHIDCQGTARVDERHLATIVRKHFQLTPSGIISELDLLRPIYSATAVHGHFGRTPGDGGEGTFTWERTDKADALRTAAHDLAGANVCLMSEDIVRTLHVILANQISRTEAAFEGLDADVARVAPGGDTHSIFEIARHLLHLRRFQLTLLESPDAASVADADGIGDLAALENALTEAASLVRNAIATHDASDWLQAPPSPRSGPWGDEPTLDRLVRPMNDFTNHLGAIRLIRRSHGNPAPRTQR